MIQGNSQSVSLSIYCLARIYRDFMNVLVSLFVHVADLVRLVIAYHKFLRFIEKWPLISPKGAFPAQCQQLNALLETVQNGHYS